MGHGQGQGLELIVRVRVRFTVANCCIETAGEGDKMRISQVIKTDQSRSAPQIRPAPHFVVSPLKAAKGCSRKKRIPRVDGNHFFPGRGEVRILHISGVCTG